MLGGLDEIKGIQLHLAQAPNWVRAQRRSTGNRTSNLYEGVPVLGAFQSVPLSSPQLLTLELMLLFGSPAPSLGEEQSMELGECLRNEPTRI